VPRREEKLVRHGARKALDANTLGEVPDGAWYTNRQRECRMTIEELKRGPGNTTPPSPEGPGRIISAKSDGVTPGFIIKDESKPTTRTTSFPTKTGVNCAASACLRRG
jgi:hypothetical protein